MRTNELAINPCTIQKSLQQENLLGALLLKCYPYWQLLLILLVVFGAGTLLYLQHKVPVYEVKTAMLAKDEQKGLEYSKIESLNAFNSKKIIENEIEVNKSKTLAHGIVKNLHLYAP